MIGLLFAFSTAAAQAPSPPSGFGTRIEEVRFPNGMRAIVAATPADPGRAPRVFVGLYVRYGAASAGPELAHLVEHIAANNRPTLVDYEIPAGLVAYGSNAMTRPDYMSLWRTVSPEGLAALIPNRANKVAGVNLDSAVFTREVGRVAAETQRRIDRIAAQGLGAADLLGEAFFGSRIPLEALLDTIRSFELTTVYGEIERWFRPDNALLIVAGDVDAAATMALIRRHLPAYARRKGPSARVGAPFAGYREPLVRRDSRVTTTRVGIGLPAPSRKSDDYLAFLVLDQLLLGGRASTRCWAAGSHRDWG
jgi:zinc protease